MPASLAGVVTLAGRKSVPDRQGHVQRSRGNQHIRRSMDYAVVVDEATRALFRELADAADELIDQVEEALGADVPQSRMRETRAAVDQLAARAKEMLVGLGEHARAAMERTLGRKLADLQKRAARLPALAAGDPATGKSPDTGFVETRPLPPSPPSSAPMSGPAPHRKPARSQKAVGASRGASRRESPDIEGLLRNATVVKPYSLEQRYEPGDVIDHPTFGRGRVERTQPRTMHVQFAIGLKALRMG